MYSKDEICELVAIDNDPTWNSMREVFRIKPTEAYLSRVDGKAPEVLTEENLKEVYLTMCQGGSLNEVCAVLKITRHTLSRWCAKEGLIFDQLRDTIATGLIQSVAWWERIGRQALMGETKYFKDHLWTVHMMNKFGWLSGKSSRESKKTEEVTHAVRVDVPNLKEIKKIALENLEPNVIDITPEVVREKV